MWFRKYVVKFYYTEEEVKHYFSPRENVIYSYVLEGLDPITKKPKITDFISFYLLPSHVMKNPKYNMLNVIIYLMLGMLFIFELRYLCALR